MFMKASKFFYETFCANIVFVISCSNSWKSENSVSEIEVALKWLGQLVEGKS